MALLLRGLALATNLEVKQSTEHLEENYKNET